MRERLKALLITRRGRFGKAMIGALLVGAGLFGVANPAEAVVPDACYGSGNATYAACTGKDPQTMGCSSGASTLATTSMPTGIIELRYSSGCYAEWARFTWAGEQAAQAATIWVESSNGTQKYTTSIAGYVGEQKWTKMITATLQSRACVNFWHNGFGQWVTNCTPYI